MQIRNWIGWAILVLVALSANPAQAQGSGLIRDGNPPDIAMVFTGDVIGFIDPCG